MIFGAGAAGLAAVAAACGGSEESAGTAAPDASEAPVTINPTGNVLATLEEVPVSGGKILKDQKIVVVQPKKGTFKAFSAACTHQSCTVGSVTDNQIVCPCHNSRFSAADGSVQAGPAPAPLPEIKIKVEGDRIVFA